MDHNRVNFSDEKVHAIGDKIALVLVSRVPIDPKYLIELIDQLLEELKKNYTANCKQIAFIESAIGLISSPPSSKLHLYVKLPYGGCDWDQLSVYAELKSKYYSIFRDKFSMSVWEILERIYGN